VVSRHSRPVRAAFFSLGLFAGACGAVHAGDALPRYALTASVALGSPDHWDYLFFDASAKRVYVSHGDEITVVDGKTGALAGQITGLPGSHGVLTVPSLARGFADSAKNHAVIEFDLTSLQPIATAQAGDDADGMAYDAASQHVFVANGDAQTVTAIDAPTGKTIATLALGAQPEFLVADGNGMLYVNGESSREIIAIDARRMKITARWPVPDCESPHGLAVDVRTERLFTSCVNGKLFVVDATSGRILAGLPIGKGSDAVAFDPQRKLVFSSNGEGTVSVIAEKSPEQFVWLADVPTVRGGRTMALDPESGRLYIVSADIDRLDPPKVPGGRQHAVYKPGSLKLFFFDPAH
jgi:YVTN family beta-propeller protein